MTIIREERRLGKYFISEIGTKADGSTGRFFRE